MVDAKGQWRDASRNTIVLADEEGDGERLQQIIAAYKRRSARSVRR